MSVLYRFQEPTTAVRLREILENGEEELSESTGHEVDLNEVRDRIQIITGLASGATSQQRAYWDQLLIEPLHQALRKVPRSVAADMRLWHRLCVIEFPEFVWLRWLGRVPENVGTSLTDAMVQRFLGSNTLHGVSRNALARLYWCAETLYSESEGYEWVRQALANQDLFQAIFEREFGLYPPAARACLRVLRNAGEQEHREATRRLNHSLTTIALESLTEEQIVRLLTA